LNLSFGLFRLLLFAIIPLKRFSFIDCRGGSSKTIKKSELYTIILIVFIKICGILIKTRLESTRKKQSKKVNLFRGMIAKSRSLNKPKERFKCLRA